jgi:hypothetical protein
MIWPTTDNDEIGRKVVGTVVIEILSHSSLLMLAE